MRTLTLIFFLNLFWVTLHGQCPTGNVQLKNQGDVNNFLVEYPNCTEIQGNLEVIYISGGNINSLAPLANLRKVHGDFSLIDTYADLDVLNIDTILGSFNLGGFSDDLSGYDKLEYIGGSLKITADNYTNLRGLENIDTLYGSLVIENTDSLQTLEGLNNLKWVGGGLRIAFNKSLANLQGLGALRAIEGDVFFRFNNVLAAFEGLAQLEEIGGTMKILDSEALTNFSGMEQVRRIGNIELFGNNGFKNFEGLSALDTIYDGLFITTNNSLENLLGLSSLKYTNDLRIQHCEKIANLEGLLAPELEVNIINLLELPRLVNLHGLQGVKDIGARLNIVNCDSLLTLDGLSLADTIRGSLTISGNFRLMDIEALQNVEYIGGDFELRAASRMEQLPALQLKHVGGSLTLASLDKVQSQDGFAQLTVVEGPLFMSSCDSLRTLEWFSGLQFAGGGLTIWSNGALNNIEGIANAQIVGSLSISYNRNLSYCSIASVCARLLQQPERVEITGNAEGCANPGEVAAQCNNGFSIIEVFYDGNSNGQKDFNERPVRIGQFTVDGAYTLFLPPSRQVAILYPDAADKQVVYQYPEEWVLTTGNDTLLFRPEDNLQQYVYIGITPEELREQFTYSLTSDPVVCNEEVSFFMNLQNTGTTIATPSFCFRFAGELLNYIPNDSIAENTICPRGFVVQELYPGDLFAIEALIGLPGVDAIGDTLHYWLNLQDNPDSLAYTYEPILLCSFDPNDKLASPGGRPEEAPIPPNTAIDYTIRFQNTGNFRAKDVVLVDTISPYLDLSTFQLLASSHPISEIRMEEDALRFSFLGIYLPDSTSNEAESHGFVQFRLAQKSDLEHQTHIRNSAAIYFDQNPPIFTNTVDRVVFDPPVSVEEKEGDGPRVLLYPNPADEWVYFKSNFDPTYYYLYNSKGRLVSQGPIGLNRIDVTALPAGFYGVLFLAGEEAGSATFIKK